VGLAPKMFGASHIYENRLWAWPYGRVTGSFCCCTE